VVRERACANGGESEQFAAPSHALVHGASAEELRAAIAAVTRALATAHEQDWVVELVRERAALRRELEVLQPTAAEPARDRVA
jgi:hypothetical protein